MLLVVNLLPLSYWLLVYDCSGKLEPFSQPIRCNFETNHDLVTCVFLRAVYLLSLSRGLLVYDWPKKIAPFSQPIRGKFSGALGTLLVVTFSQTPCDEFLNVFLIFCAVYPPLAEMTEEDKNNSWKPGQRKKKSEKVDSTWNPKSK